MGRNLQSIEQFARKWQLAGPSKADGKTKNPNMTRTREGINRVQSSRRLERKCQRNVELVWLSGHLMPDFKTIADFRKDNGVPAGLDAMFRNGEPGGKFALPLGSLFWYYPIYEEVTSGTTKKERSSSHRARSRDSHSAFGRVAGIN